MRRLIAVFLTVLIPVCMLSACVTGSDTPKTLDLVVVASNRACNPIHNYRSERIQSCIYTSLASGGTVYAIALDGNPHSIGELKAKTARMNPAAAERNVKKAAEQITAELVASKAETEESDPLRAIALAAETLKYSNGDEKELYILDNLIQTKGYINMVTGLLDKNIDCDLIIEKLLENNYIPDLSAVKEVIVQNLGEVSNPQESLTPNMKETLVQLWSRIIEAGGSKLSLATGSIGDSKADDYPHVSTIPIIKDEPLIGYYAAFDEPVFLGESQVSFKPGQAIILDESKARTTLKPIADYMKRNPEFELLVCGCCAGDLNSEFGIELSEYRAGAIRAKLIEMGADQRRIQILGLGSRNPWHVKADLASELSQKNRVCVLLDASTRDRYGV